MDVHEAEERKIFPCIGLKSSTCTWHFVECDNLSSHRTLCLTFQYNMQHFVDGLTLFSLIQAELIATKKVDICYSEHS